MYHPTNYLDMSRIKTVGSCSLYGRWKLNVFQVSPANTHVGSADERALDAPSRPWCRFVLTVNLWSSRFLGSSRQEDHPIDERVNEIPIFASLRRLLQMGASGGAVRRPYTESSSPWCHSTYKCAEIVCYSFVFQLAPWCITDTMSASSRVD